MIPNFDHDFLVIKFYPGTKFASHGSNDNKVGCVLSSYPAIGDYSVYTCAYSNTYQCRNRSVWKFSPF